MRRTKILATLGPVSCSEQMIHALIDAGANGFRLNFSHGTHEFFKPLIEMIRSAAQKFGRPVAILQDLQGPKIRTGLLTDGKPVELRQGNRFTITNRSVPGNESIVSTTYAHLPEDVRPGDRILIDDGAMELRVLNVGGDTDVETEIIIGGVLKEKKGLNLPGVKVSAPSMTEKDRIDACFGADHGVDYIALSFVRTAQDVQRLRALLTERNHSEIRVIAKIEKPEALNNLKEILEVSDGVMVARGDLGVEMPAGKVPIIQKTIIEQANRAEKLVITATQMLESMVENTRPTRAEASDVANAILDGTDVAMLSQETAIGKHPVAAVQMMGTIACYTEENDEIFRYVDRIRADRLQTFTDAIVHSVRVAAEVIHAKAILVFTQSGSTAQLASCRRPGCPIFAFTPSRKTCDQLSLVWGVFPFVLDLESDYANMTMNAEKMLIERKILQPGDAVVVVSGTQPERGSTNMMRIQRIGI